MSGPTLTINRTTREVTLVRSPIGLQGIPGDDSLTADELAAIQGSATPSAANVFATMADANLCTVSIQSGNYPLVAADSVVVFTATATATLPAATGSGRTYRVVCRAGTLTIDPAGAETIKGETTAVLSAGEDLIVTDTAMGVWE